MRPRILRCLIILAVLAGLSACSAKKEVSWKEEVRLSDGSVIVIDRSQSYRRAREPAQKAGWLFDYATLEATLPPRARSVRWEGPAQPLVLDIDKAGQIYLLATMETFEGLRHYQVAEGTWYVGFRFDGETWMRVNLGEFPRGMSPNLLASTWELFIKEQQAAGSLVPLSLKQTIDTRGVVARHYRQLIGLN
jgi:hypothetical protein